jgi:hypothetical protein
MNALPPDVLAYVLAFFQLPELHQISAAASHFPALTAPVQRQRARECAAHRAGYAAACAGDEGCIGAFLAAIVPGACRDPGPEAVMGFLAIDQNRRLFLEGACIIPRPGVTRRAIAICIAARLAAHFRASLGQRASPMADYMAVAPTGRLAGEYERIHAHLMGGGRVGRIAAALTKGTLQELPPLARAPPASGKFGAALELARADVAESCAKVWADKFAEATVESREVLRDGARGTIPIAQILAHFPPPGEVTRGDVLPLLGGGHACGLLLEALSTNGPAVRLLLAEMLGGSDEAYSTHVWGLVEADHAPTLPVLLAQLAAVVDGNHAAPARMRALRRVRVGGLHALLQGTPDTPDGTFARQRLVDLLCRLGALGRVLGASALAGGAEARDLYTLATRGHAGCRACGSAKPTFDPNGYHPVSLLPLLDHPSRASVWEAITVSAMQPQGQDVQWRLLGNSMLRRPSFGREGFCRLVGMIAARKPFRWGAPATVALYIGANSGDLLSAAATFPSHGADGRPPFLQHALTHGLQQEGAHLAAQKCMLPNGLALWDGVLNDSQSAPARKLEWLESIRLAFNASHLGEVVAPSGQTPLHALARNVDATHALLPGLVEGCGSFLDMAYWQIHDSEGTTPLMLAASHGNVELVQDLLGGNLHMKQVRFLATRDHLGRTALMHGAMCDRMVPATHASRAAQFAPQMRVLELLLEAGAEPEATDIHGRTALHHVGPRPMLELMLMNKFNHLAKDGAGLGVVDHLSRRGAVGLLYALRTAKCMPETSYETALLGAARLGHSAVVELLLNPGYPSTYPPASIDEAAIAAIQGGHVATATSLAGFTRARTLALEAGLGFYACSNPHCTFVTSTDRGMQQHVAAGHAPGG